MTPDIRAILERCIEVGIDFGYDRAHKHGDNPTEQHIKSEIENAIWSEIDRYFKFEDEE